MLKKIGLGIGILFCLLLAAIVVIPLVVDVDRYRPQIVEQIQQRINGKVELGKLHLSLWGQIKIEVGGLKILGTSENEASELLSVREAYFYLPWSSLFSGAPTLTFRMEQPTVKVIRDRKGKLNLMALMKESQGAQAGSAVAPQTATTATPASSSDLSALPGIVLKARLGIEFHHAEVSYRDEATQLTTQVKDLNLSLKDISMSYPIGIELVAHLDTQMGKMLNLKGSAKLTGKIQLALEGGKIANVHLISHLDLDDVLVQVPDLFEKKSGILAQADLALLASETKVTIEKFDLKFHRAEMGMTGTVNLSAMEGQFSVKTNRIEMKPWEELVPMLKAFDLGGAVKLEAEAKGPLMKIGYRADIHVEEVSAKTPQVKVAPKISGDLQIATDQVKSISLTMTAPGSDLKLQGQLLSFTKPQLNVTVTSTGMDLDQWVVFPPAVATAKPAAGAEAAVGGAGAGKAAAVQDFDAMLAPLRSNPMIAAFVGQIGVKMKFLKAKQMTLDDLHCNLSWKDLSAGMDACGFNIFGGSIQSDAHLQFKSQMPTYQFNAQIKSLDLAQAVASQMALFKNTVIGKASFSIKGQGASFNPDPAIARLKASGSLSVRPAKFETIDVMKMVGEGLDKAMNDLGNKIPALKGQSLSGKMPSKGGAEYEFISSDFSIENSKFTSPNFYAKSKPGQSVDLKGRTVVGLKDYSLDTTWEVIDTDNVTHLRDISVDQQGVRVEHLFAEGAAPVHFPMHVGCTVKAPCYSSTEVPVALGKVALANVGKAMTGRAKEEVKKQAESVIKQIAPPAVQEQLKNKLKGFFN